MGPPTGRKCNGKRKRKKMGKSHQCQVGKPWNCLCTIISMAKTTHILIFKVYIGFFFSILLFNIGLIKQNIFTRKIFMSWQFDPKCSLEAWSNFWHILQFSQASHVSEKFFFSKFAYWLQNLAIMLLLQWHHSQNRLWGFVFAERDWVGNWCWLIEGFGWEPFALAFFQQKKCHLRSDNRVSLDQFGSSHKKQ